MPEPTMPTRTDTPADALGPTALVLGALSTVGVCAPALFLFPWAVIAGALAVTLGATGIRYALQGTGRLCTAVAGTVLGAVGFVGTGALIWVLGVS
ncbi:hypothetical protein ACFXKG_20760 [Streptomyces sp. NPDC059255]|uniref:hypothetical protein n=1 Tax=Streptomyces sp. NPDC059255 TaxID=3346793 RepID=UPI003678A65A